MHDYAHSFDCMQSVMHFSVFIIAGNSAVLFASNKGSSVHLTAGRVDIFFAGHWGTICSKGVTLSDAQGLCHILTGSSTVLAYGSVGSENLE